jgi:branched-chain amino acid transport system ATP-binding protein
VSRVGSEKRGLLNFWKLLGVTPRLNHKPEELSGGEQQMLAIARGLMSRPKLLCLDEPSLGLAPVMVDKIMESVQIIKKEATILLVEQNVKLALTVAPYAYVLENGRLVMHDTSDKLKQNPDIRDFYLGLSDIGERKSFRQVKLIHIR